MATSSDRTSLPPAGAPGHNGHRPGGKLVEYDEFIDAQLRTTRSHVRSVDLACELMVLAAGTLTFFLLAGVVDHWVIPGGLGFWGRLLLFAGLIAVVGYALVVRVLPLLLRRINPLYAAHTIERSSPALKNSLVNFLMFRANPAALNDNVYQAIEEQAATRLAGTHVEAAVDRTKLIRIGYVLVAIVVAAALYAIVSPKNLFKTVGRVVMPWAQIDAPTRTVISQIEPRDTQAFRGQQVTVTAFIDGLPAEATPRVLVSSADGQIVDAAVEMTLASNEYRHSCVLPAADASLQQSLTYRIEAGDAVTRPYMISVVAAPTIVVDSVEYKYPSYTGLLAQRVEHQGDIKAIEGTEITIHATANENIQSAYVDFDCDGKLDQPMQTDAAAASAKFTIELKPDRQTPAQSSYQLVFKNDAGQANPQPVRHRIEVTRDLPPEIQLVAPKKDEIDLPVNGAIDLEIIANDPDFALRSVKLSAARGDEPLFEKSFLNEVWRGQLVRKFRFEPTKLGLKQGDQVTYFAVAEDNKEPQPNRSETTKRRIRIVSPVDRKISDDHFAKYDKNRDDDQPSGERKPGGDGQQGHDDDSAKVARDDQNKPGDPRGDDNAQGAKPKDSPEPRDGQGDDRSDQQDSKDKSQDGQGTGQKSNEGKDGEQQGGAGDESQAGGEQQAAPNDGSNDRDAIERILDRRDEQNKGKSDSQGSERPSKGDEQQPGSQGQGDQQGADQKAGRDPSTSPAKDNSGKDQPSQGKQQGDRKPAENSSPDKSDKPSNGKQSQLGPDEQGADKGTQKSKGRPEGQEKSARDKSTQQNKGQGSQAGNDESASSDAAEGQSGKKGTSAQRKPADTKPANSKPDGDGKSDDATAPGEKSAKGKGRASDKQPTEKQASDKQPGDDAAKSTDDASGKGKPSKSSKADAKPDAKRTQPGDKQDPSTDGDARPADESGDPKDSKGNSDNKSGQGKQSKPDPTGKRDAAQSREKKDSDEQASPGEKEKGNAGAGKPSDDSKGSPEPQGKNQPREKSPRESADEANQKPSDAKSPSTSHRESNSEGKEDGDRSGGGKKGGGQQANQKGTGGAGQNTPSDEGAGKSDEAGKGDSSNRPGDDRQSSGKTGQSGSQRGEGSQAKPTQGEGQPGQGAPQGGDKADAKQGESTPGNQTGQPGSAAPDQPSGGRPGSSPTDRKWQPTEDAADEANLEYARKATDLAITHLKDELKKDNPDPELLNRLHWTREDLQKFVKRWEQMRTQAKVPGETGASARRELDDALRSLGLRPRATSMKGDAARGDKSQGYKESRRSSPPPEYAEQYKAYTQGTAKGGK